METASIAARLRLRRGEAPPAPVTSTDPAARVPGLVSRALLRVPQSCSLFVVRLVHVISIRRITVWQARCQHHTHQAGGWRCRLVLATPRACNGKVVSPCAQVNKTINQMVMFIRQEAEEKAAEISVSAEEEFNITRLQVSPISLVFAAWTVNLACEDGCGWGA